MTMAKIPKKNHDALWIFRLGRRGSVALLFALSLIPIVIVVSVALDMSRLTDGRAILQRAVDNAALSGAAAYTVDSASAKTAAITSATAAFCAMTVGLPETLAVVTSGGTTPQPCNGNPGPTVAAVIGGYVYGTPGNTGGGCSATNAAVAGVECGFVVTVTATATLNSLVPALFGATKSIAVTGVALNPFINIANSIKASIQGSAYNTNSVWLYPLLLNANGQPDFSTNLGALPNVSGSSFPEDAASSLCTDDPSQTSCGPYTMIADTAFVTASNVCPVPSSGCTPFGAGGANFKNGAVQNPAAPTAVITATTPIGVAFQSIAGGGLSYGFNCVPAIGATPTSCSGGGYPGYPAAGVSTTSGCYYPGNAVYNTAVQVYNNGLTGGNSYYGPPPATQYGLPWPKVTHWFYSSYLLNGLPPTEGEILSQANPSIYSYTSISKAVSYNEDVQMVSNNSSDSFNPPLVNCDSGLQYTPTRASDTDEFVTTSYFNTATDNVNLFVIEQTGTGASVPYYAPSAVQYNGVNVVPTKYTVKFYPQDATKIPGGTPGANFAGLSCQAYGNNTFTFYWNDAGGYTDDLDYNNGSAIIACSGPAFVVLIQ